MVKIEKKITVITKPRTKYYGRDEVIKHLDKLLDENVCGNLKINIFKGGISSWNVDVSYIPSDKK